MPWSMTRPSDRTGPCCPSPPLSLNALEHDKTVRPHDGGTAPWMWLYADPPPPHPSKRTTRQSSLWHTTIWFFSLLQTATARARHLCVYCSMPCAALALAVPRLGPSNGANHLGRVSLHMAFLPPSAPYHHRVTDKGRAAAPVRGPTAGPVRGCLYTSRSGEAASNKPLPHTAAPVCVAYTPVARTHMPSTRAAPPVARRKRGPLSARGEARAEL